MLLKIAFQKHIHLYKGDMQLKGVKKHCQNVFKTIPKSFQFYYLDSDQDQISISSQQDLDIIFDSQETTSIKKIFVREIQEQFENLQDLPNPEEQDILTKENYCKLKNAPKNYAKDIKIINIFEETLKKNREEQLYDEEVNKYVGGYESKIIEKIIEEEQRMIERETYLYLGDISNKIISQFNKQEESLVKEQVFKYMDSIIEDCSIKVVKDQETKRNQQKESQEKERLSRVDSHSISKLLDEKINQLLPTLIKRVAKAVEDRISIDGCTKCRKRQTELDFQDLIRAQLMKKVQGKNFAS